MQFSSLIFLLSYPEECLKTLYSTISCTCNFMYLTFFQTVSKEGRFCNWSGKGECSGNQSERQTGRPTYLQLYIIVYNSIATYTLVVRTAIPQVSK